MNKVKNKKYIIYVSRAIFFISLFLTACTFCESWHMPFMFNDGYKVLKIFLALCLPFGTLVLNYSAEKNLRFSGRAAAVIMALFVILYYADKYTLGYISCYGDFMVPYHLAYSMVSFFSAFAAALICTAADRKRCSGFSEFYNAFFKGYLIVFLFVFIQIYFVLRQYNSRADINLVPFGGEIGMLAHNFSNITNNALPLIRSAGNVLFFATIPPLIAAFDSKKRLLPMLAVPFAASVAAEMFQYLLKCGDTDIDDIILNTLGAAAGVVLYKYIINKIIERDKECLV